MNRWYSLRFGFICGNPSPPCFNLSFVMASNGDVSLLSRIIFRRVLPTDVSLCYQIESASYPDDEAASKAKLQYRQHHAAPFFRCAFLVADDGDNYDGRTSASSSISYRGQSMHPSATLRGTIIGFVCATRCDSFTAEAMKMHDAAGKILAIHSVVVDERYRNHGVASAMLQDYISAMESLNEKGKLKTKMEKIVLISKKQLLAFYVRSGFSVTGVSPVVHGKEEWFELERNFASAKNASDANSHECHIVDSFADVEKQGSGNPAAVVILNEPPGVTSEVHGGNARDGSLEEDLNEDDDEMAEGEINIRGVQWMSTVAKEFNQSETAFIWPHRRDQTVPQLQDDDAQTPTYAIRYYTRTGVEVDLCGHATLAAACCVFQRVSSQPIQRISFLAKNDNLQADLRLPSSSQSTDVKSNSSNACRIVMQFPWKNVTPILPEKDKDEVLSMMSRAFFGSHSLTSFTQHVIQIGTTDGMEDLFIELSEEGFDSLCRVHVDYNALLSWDGYTRGVIICCCSTVTNSVDFRSRFFGPKVGIDEDPVTGSAHCSLGPYFGEKLGKSFVVGRQESERGGMVECMLKKEEGRVSIAGTAVMVMSGHLAIGM